MDLQKLDLKHIWHPFTQAETALVPKLITKAYGPYLEDDQGCKYLDLISSWWVNIHGHAHPKIAKAIYDQALKLEQVIFADFTHESAIKLASKLCALLPSFDKVFFSDNGSTSVEVALKMAIQYWQNIGYKTKHKFIGFKDSYHGDTFGSMAVGQTSAFFAPFKQLLFNVEFFDFPETWLGAENPAVKEAAILQQLESYICQHKDDIAGLIIEPLVQGAGGFKMCRPAFIDQLLALCQANDILTIFDEVMTGFGRTGTMFACEQITNKPDFLCLSKGITGGFLPLAVTLTTNKIYEAFLNHSFSKAFAHGHSYTANPLSCSAALASLELFEEEHTLARIKYITDINTREIKNLAARSSQLHKPRVMGSIAAFNIGQDHQYLGVVSQKIKTSALDRGLVIRPLGNVVYLLPPYCLTSAELAYAYQALEEIIMAL